MSAQRWIVAVLLVTLAACSRPELPIAEESPTQPYVTVLGVAQDGGVPHIGCDKACCREL